MEEYVCWMRINNKRETEKRLKESAAAMQCAHREKPARKMRKKRNTRVRDRISSGSRLMLRGFVLQ